MRRSNPRRVRLPLLPVRPSRLHRNQPSALTLSKVINQAWAAAAAHPLHSPS